MKHLPQILTIFLFLAAPSQANQDGVIVRQAPVYAKPSTAVQQVGQIKAGSRVSVFDRRGGWQEIFSEKQGITGWVRSYQVRQGNFAPQVKTETSSDSRGFLSGLASLSRRASGFFKSSSGSTSSGTATIGVRGLSEDEIKSAVADFEEFERMKQFASSQKRMNVFTSQGGLSATRVPYISESK
ncbi:MAG: SH3 domain-containing protein [Gammaproteobacteria bacterium]|nr:SH3 domain-containing protein [Gammaproteobacteria bacterium]